METQARIKEEQISGAIYVYHNGLSDELCDTIWDFYYENIEITRAGKTAGGLFAETKNTLDIYDNESFIGLPQLKQRYEYINEEIYASLRVATSMYIDKHDWLKSCPNLSDTNYLWQGYKRGEGFYKEHVDGENWSQRVKDRVLAVVIYINTVNEGGETYFRYQNVSVKPVKGSICLFPAHWTYPHQAQVPLSSDKLIISSFIVTPQNH